MVPPGPYKDIPSSHEGRSADQENTSSAKFHGGIGNLEARQSIRNEAEKCGFRLTARTKQAPTI